MYWTLVGSSGSLNGGTRAFVCLFEDEYWHEGLLVVLLLFVAFLINFFDSRVVLLPRKGVVGQGGVEGVLVHFVKSSFCAMVMLKLGIFCGES